MSWKYHSSIGGGVIDSDYRGNVGVMLFNHGKDEIKIKAGERVAQMIIERIEFPEVKEVKELPETNRGEGGFGSTGLPAVANRLREDKVIVNLDGSETEVEDEGEEKWIDAEMFAIDAVVVNKPKVKRGEHYYAIFLRGFINQFSNWICLVPVKANFAMHLEGLELKKAY